MQSLVEEEFVLKLAKRVGQLNIGHGARDGMMMGPVISSARGDVGQGHLRDGGTSALPSRAKLLLPHDPNECESKIVHLA